MFLFIVVSSIIIFQFQIESNIQRLMEIIEDKVQVNSEMNNAHRTNESMVQQTLDTSIEGAWKV